MAVLDSGQGYCDVHTTFSRGIRAEVVTSPGQDVVARRRVNHQHRHKRADRFEGHPLQWDGNPANVLGLLDETSTYYVRNGLW